jgi:hypothetical protein
MLIIALGQTGINIAAKFNETPGFELIAIGSDSDKIPTKIDFSKVLKVREQKNSEEYENRTDLSGLEDFAKGTQESSVCLICSSCGRISGLTLRILEMFQGKILNVLLVVPDESLLIGNKKTQSKITLGVLQEFARSGLLNSLLIINNRLIEKIYGKLSVFAYFDKINAVIYHAFKTWNIFQNTTPVFESRVEVPEISRIMTISVCDLGSREEQAFFELKNIGTKDYFLLISKAKLEEDEALLESIKLFVMTKKSEDTEVGFHIYESTETNSDLVYIIGAHYSSKIQELD